MILESSSQQNLLKVWWWANTLLDPFSQFLQVIIKRLSCMQRHKFNLVNAFNWFRTFNSLKTTLFAWHSTQGVCIAMYTTGSMLNSKVVRWQNVNPSRKLAFWIFELHKPSKWTVVCFFHKILYHTNSVWNIWQNKLLLTILFLLHSTVSPILLSNDLRTHRPFLCIQELAINCTNDLITGVSVQSEFFVKVWMCEYWSRREMDFSLSKDNWQSFVHLKSQLVVRSCNGFAIVAKFFTNFR